VTDLLHDGRPVPFILLTEDADEKTVADIIGGGTWNWLAKSRLDGATLVRTIHNTVALHSLQMEQQSAEESLRKLSRAVEQSADTVVITDCHGVIEYINLAFEALTGYSLDEVHGKTPRILKSGGARSRDLSGNVEGDSRRRGVSWDPERGGSETILLVEDEAAVRRATAEFLRLQGYNVIEARDGVDALALAQEQATIHLVVSDVVMPRMSGGALAKEVARVRPDTQFLFVSGYAGKTILDHKVVDLETNFLQKPYTLRQLSSKIRKALDIAPAGR
jgi:PAS domain S-box-containing protein